MAEGPGSSGVALTNARRQLLCIPHEDVCARHPKNHFAFTVSARCEPSFATAF